MTYKRVFRCVHCERLYEFNQNMKLVETELSKYWSQKANTPACKECKGG